MDETPLPFGSTTQLQLPWLQDDSSALAAAANSDRINGVEDERLTPPTEIDPTDNGSVPASDGPGTPNWPQRVLHLEQALDQCQAYIAELKQQLVEQEFLADLLARTEETAQIQQQAILSLKQQLEDYHATQAKLTQLQTDYDTLHGDLKHLEQSYQAQSHHLSHATQLNEQYQQEIQQLTQQLRPQQEQLHLLQQRIGQLEHHVQERQQAMTDLEARLQRSAQVVTAQQDIIAALHKATGSESSKNQVIQSLSQKLVAAETKISTLEADYSHQRLQQAQLQHHAQEVEEHAIQQQVRINKLEQQVAEMQEQILHQAQQAREQETAVQHWKDRHHQAEKTIVQLKAIVNNILTDRHLLELLHLDAETVGIAGNEGIAHLARLLCSKEKDSQPQSLQPLLAAEEKTPAWTRPR